MATIEVQGVPHSYDLTAPTAVPAVLVFIHSWLLSRNYWHPLIQELAPDYQCLTYDLRGFGDSEDQGPASIAPAPIAPASPPSTQAPTQPPNHTQPRSPHPLGAYSPKAYAQDLLSLLDALQIQNAWLVGHSLGGTIALWTALLGSDRIRGVTCVNAGGGLYVSQEFERSRRVGARLVQIGQPWMERLPWLDLTFGWAGATKPIARNWRQQRLRDFVQANRTAALGVLLQSTTEAEVHRLPWVVSRLQQPVYFIAGDRDRITHPRYVQHLASFHPMFCGGANLLALPDCGHFAMLEQPQALAGSLRDMIDRHPLGMAAPSPPVRAGADVTAPP